MPNNSYVGAVQIDSYDQVLVGSTLFGVCDTAANTAAKMVTLTSFDALLNGVTVQVKFTSGNTVTTNVTLKINTTDALPVTGNCVCEANQVIAFTFENVNGTRYWRSHHNISGAMPISGGTFTGDVSFDSGKKLTINAPSSDSEAATKKYVDDKTTSITGVLHFKGITTTAMSDGLTVATVVINGSNYTPVAGDVVLSGTYQEYVWVEINESTHTGYWELLGDEGSYKLKQTAITDSTGSADGTNTATTFIYSFSQDAQGVVSVKTRNLPTYNNYSHPTGDGNLHVPATGTTNNGKFLKAGNTAGSISWASLTANDIPDISGTYLTVANGIQYFNNHDKNIDTLITTPYIQTAQKEGGAWLGTKPSGSNNGIALFNFQTSTGNYYSQLALDTDQNRIWMRSANNASSYGTWSKVAYTADIEALNVSNIVGFGNTKTLATLTETNGKIAATFQDIAFPVTSVAGKTGAVTLVKGDVGLENVDNTADAIKSVNYATSAGLLAGTARNDTTGMTTDPGTGKINYSYAVYQTTTGMFNATNNANSIITIKRHSTNYFSQIGFSSDGRIYYRDFENAILDTTTDWSKIAFTSDIPTNLNQLTNGPGYVTSSGVTSITLKAGAGISLDTDNTAITSTGTRTISISGMNTSSGSTTKWLNEKGEWSTPTATNVGAAESSHTHPVSDLTWGGSINLIPTATANNQEWSIDLTPGDYTGTYWQIQTTKSNNTGTILACYADDKHITMPGDIASTSTNSGTLQVSGGIGVTGQVTAARLAANGSNTSYNLYVNGTSYLNGNTTISGTVSFTSLGEGLEFVSDDNYFGTNLDARIIQMISSNASGSEVDGGLIIRAVGRSNDSETGVQELLRIRNHNGSSDWKTGEFQWKTKDIVVANGTNSSWSISITGNASSATTIKVNSAATTKSWITGTSTTLDDASSTINADPLVYLTTTLGQMSAKSYSVNDGGGTPEEKVRMEWNSTDQSLDFIFA